MLSKANRLQKKRDIERVFRKGKTIKEGFLCLRVVGNNLLQSRFAFVVSRKVSKRAVVRNKIRRQIRELLRLKIKTIKAGKDAIFIALPGLEEKKFQEIKKNLEKLLSRAKLIDD